MIEQLKGQDDRHGIQEARQFIHQTTQSLCELEKKHTSNKDASTITNFVILQIHRFCKEKI